MKNTSLHRNNGSKDLKVVMNSIDLELDIKLSDLGTGLWKWTAEGNSVYISDETKLLFGYSPYEIPNKVENSTSLIHPDDVFRLESSARKYISHEIDKFEVEFRLKTRNGNYRWVLAKVMKKRTDEHGALLELSGIFFDIDEKKRLDEQLENSEKLFSQFTENFPGLAYIIDSHGEFTFINKNMKRANLGNKLLENIRRNNTLLDSKLERVLKNSFIETEENFIDCLGKERIYKTRKFMLQTDRNKIGCLAFDITDESRKIKELTEQENLFDSLIRKSPVAILMHEKDKITYANPLLEKLTGYNSDELIGESIWKLFQPDSAKLLKKDMLTGKYGKTNESCQLIKILTSNGKIKWGAMIVTHTKISCKKIFLTSIVDITSYKLQQTNLEKMYMLRSSLSEIEKHLLDGQPKEKIISETYQSIKSCLPHIESGFLVYERIDGKHKYMNFDSQFTIGRARFILEKLGNISKITLFTRKEFENAIEVEDFKPNKSCNSFIVAPVRMNERNVGFFVLVSSIGAGDFSKSDIAMLEMFNQMTCTFYQKRYMEKQIQNEKNIAYYQATHDATTGLPNERYLKEKLTIDIKRSGRKTAFINLEISNLETVKNIYGSIYAKNILISFTSRLKNNIAEISEIIQLNEKDFLICHPVDDNDEVEKIIETVKKIFNEPISINDEMQLMRIDFGVSVYPDDGRDTDKLIRFSSIARKIGVSTPGENYYFRRTYIEGLNRRHLMINKMYDALKNEKIDLYYQPITDLKTGRIVFMEALARWTEEELGIIPPSTFISLAEDTGQIHSLGRFILQKAAKQLEMWNQKNIGIPVHVNVSAKEFMRSDYVEKTLKVISGYNIDKEMLGLEITESSLMEDIEHSHEKLLRLRSANIRVSLDDFGTGYSSFSYLKDLPVDYLKIDGSFVKEIEKENYSEKNMAIVKSTIALAKNLGLKTIAEGVETEYQKEKLQEVSCDFMQGFLFSKALSADEVEKLILEDKEN